MGFWLDEEEPKLAKAWLCSAAALALGASAWRLQHARPLLSLLLDAAAFVWLALAIRIWSRTNPPKGKPL